MRERCLIMEREGNRVLVSASDFNFRWVPVAVIDSPRTPEAGDVVVLDLDALVPAAPRGPAWARLASRAVAVAAAVLLLLVVTWTQVGQAWYLQAARGYLARDRAILALDINPSVELYVDQKLVTVEAGLALDEEGRRLIRGLEYGKPVGATLTSLVGSLREQGYLGKQPVALVVGTVRMQARAREQVEGALNAVLTQASGDVLLLVQNLDEELWNAARRQGESANYERLRERAAERNTEFYERVPLRRQLEELQLPGVHTPGTEAPSGDGPGPGSYQRPAQTPQVPGGSGLEPDGPATGGPQNPEQPGESGESGSSGPGYGEPGVTQPGEEPGSGSDDGGPPDTPGDGTRNTGSGPRGPH